MDWLTASAAAAGGGDGDGSIVALSEGKLFLIPPGGEQGCQIILMQRGSNWTEKWEKQDFCLLYRRMHTMYAHHPHRLGPVFCIYLAAHLLTPAKRVHDRAHTCTHKPDRSSLACVLRLVFMCGPGL